MTAPSPALAQDRAIASDDEGILAGLGIRECVRLRMRIDAARLAAELGELPEDTWGEATRANRDPVVQASVDSFFAVGHPRGPRPLPPEDRAPLAWLPYLREIVREWVPAQPTRVIVARVRAGGLIPIHTDTPRFFRGTVRLSMQIAADPNPRLYCGGWWYEMAPEEVWAVDNLRPHGIRNPGSIPRLNVLADYLPSNELLALVQSAERGLGVQDEAASAELRELSRRRYREYRWRGIRYEIWKRLWRRG